MKKLLLLVFVSTLLLLGGCSFLSDTKDTLTYLNEVKDYLTSSTDFANQVPALAEQAVTDIQAAEDLVTLLSGMQEQLDAFNELEPPDFAAELHQQLIEQNNLIAGEIEEYLNNLQNGLLDPALLENNELLQTLEEVSTIINQIQQLGEQ